MDIMFEQSREETESQIDSDTLARIFTSLKRSADSIDWRTQQIVTETDANARRLLMYAQDVEFRQFGIHLEFLLRQFPQWQRILRSILFTDGDLIAESSKVPVLLEEESKSTTDPDQLLKEFLQD